MNNYKVLCLHNHLNNDNLINILNILNKKTYSINKFKYLFNKLYLLKFIDIHSVYDYLHNFYIISRFLSKYNNYKYISQSLYIVLLTQQMFTHTFNLYIKDSKLFKNDLI